MPAHYTLNALAKGSDTLNTKQKNRQTAEIKRQQGEEELKRLQTRKTEGSVETEVQALTAQNKQLISEVQKSNIFKAFDMYSADGNPRHLNQILTENPELRSKLGMPNNPVAKLSKLDPVNDAKLIDNSDKDVFSDDFNQEDLETSAIAENRFLKTTMADGTEVVTDMTQLYQGTGYTKKLNDDQLDEMLAKANIEKARRGKVGTVKGDGPLERDAKVVAAAKERIAAGKPEPQDTEIVRFANSKQQGTSAGKADAAEQAQADMLALVGDDEGWQALDLSSRVDRLKVEPFIQRMEKVGGLSLDRDSEKVLTRTAKLLAFAKPVAGAPGARLSAKETGMMDDLMFSVSKYTDGAVSRDQIRGLQASSAYNAFRNDLRHALYGSALTTAEIESFNKSFGTLKQQFPQVMAQFGVMLGGLKEDLENVRNLNNTYVAEYRIGGSLAQADILLENIDDMISATNRVMTAPPVVEKKKKGGRTPEEILSGKGA